MAESGELMLLLWNSLDSIFLVAAEDAGRVQLLDLEVMIGWGRYMT